MMIESPLAPHASTPAELQRAHRSGTHRTARSCLYRDGGGDSSASSTSDEAGDHVTIGRRERHSNTIALEWDSEVSGVHAELERIGGGWAIIDDGLSRNGTYVNGKRIGGRRRLHDGDMLAPGPDRSRLQSTGRARPAGDDPRMPRLLAPTVELSETQRRGPDRAVSPATRSRERTQHRPPTSRSRRSCSSAWMPSRPTCAPCSASSASSNCRRTRSARSSCGAPCSQGSCPRASSGSSGSSRSTPWCGCGAEPAARTLAGDDDGEAVRRARLTRLAPTHGARVAG